MRVLRTPYWTAGSGADEAFVWPTCWEVGIRTIPAVSGVGGRVRLSYVPIQDATLEGLAPVGRHPSFDLTTQADQQPPASLAAGCCQRTYPPPEDKLRRGQGSGSI
ncbi:hypothetical protein CIRG_03483 [Coccidioides immitis RMSCC 2394]|uniref:Uncharacterized protein n=1 Tax=Coccidioides immitis RMSCC 2394 TaxID=404692 RepID=A0A0J6Y556_COCIT|nr:hypothetical protein CIRG_03483 [Coccidioides immitis RMSCC 2394]